MNIGVSLPVREMENDLGAIRAFAELAEELDFTHLRVPDQVIRGKGGHLHEPLTLLTYIAAITSRIELVPSVIILPLRQTALVAKQTAELDILAGGRMRLGIGVGSNEAEYKAMGQDFHTRGARCDEQLKLLKLLWTQPSVQFAGRFDQVDNLGLAPLPIQRPLPIWVGASAKPSAPVIRRIGTQCDGWFVLCSPEEFPEIRDAIDASAQAAGRERGSIGAEAGVAVVGPREQEWQARVTGWRERGLSHLCLRTLGGGLDPAAHLSKLREIVDLIPA